MGGEYVKNVSVTSRRQTLYQHHRDKEIKAFSIFELKFNKNSTDTRDNVHRRDSRAASSCKHWCVTQCRTSCEASQWQHESIVRNPQRDCSASGFYRDLYVGCAMFTHPVAHCFHLQSLRPRRKSDEQHTNPRDVLLTSM